MKPETRQVPEVHLTCCRETGKVLNRQPTGRMLTVYRGCCDTWHATSDKFCGQCGKRLAAPLGLEES